MGSDSKLRAILSNIRHPVLWWRRLSPHSMLKYVLGIVRHPSQAPARIRELHRIAKAPPVDDPIPSDVPADIEVIPVTADTSLREALVAIYANNPSPYSRGPMSMEELQERLERGLRFYLLKNHRGEYVGVRAFDPARKLLRNTVTDFRHRGNGYQYAAVIKLREQLAAEGFRELHSVLLKRNTRMLRTMRAAGWRIAPDPNNSELMRAVLALED